MKPKILFLTHVGDPGGAEFIMMRLCESVRDQCSVVHFERGAIEKYLGDLGIDHAVLPMPALMSGIRREGGVASILKAIPAVLSMVKGLSARIKNADQVVCMSQKSFFLAVLSKVFVRRPIIWFMNDLISTEHFSKPLIFLMTKVFASFAKDIVVNSQASYDAWVASGGRADRVHIIYPGTDEKVIDAQLERTDVIQAYRKKFTLDDAPLIGVFGRICDWKGQDVFLKALARLPHARGVIVGEAFFDQKPFLKTLEDYIAQENLTDRVHFAGHVDDVPCLMAACDVVVHASTQPEPFGLVIVEAMMSGTPVIISNAGGAREIVVEGESGLLSAPSDDAALAEAVQRYLDDPKWAQNVAKNAREHAVVHFSNDTMIIRFKGLLAQL